MHKTKTSKSIYKLSLILVFLALMHNPAYASAGYYPINKGETLNVTACIPERGRSANPPLILNIQGPKTNGQNVEVTRVTKWAKKKGNCGKWEYEVTIPWKVNVTGVYTLVITAPNSQNPPFNVWPEGIDIPDQSPSKSSGTTSSSDSTATKLTDKQITSIMATCVKKNIKRANSGENILDQGFLDVTMAILSDCVESTNSNIRCAQNNRGITVCGLIGKRIGISLPAVMGNVLTGAL